VRQGQAYGDGEAGARSRRSEQRVEFEYHQPRGTGLEKRMYFHPYVIIDIYIRYVPVWL
jgi:hypothetical protein